MTFNGTSATPAHWSNGSLTVRVPNGATTGSIVVTVLGAASNGSSFTVTPISQGTISGTITRATGGSAVSGATVEARLAGVLKSSATTAANGTYSIASLDPATYDVRVLASGFSTEVRSTSVSPNATSTVNIALSQPGSISGTITQANGTTPIVGAAVTLYLGPVAKAATRTNGTGAYSLTGAAPGAYTVQAASVAFRTKQQGATIAENANTTANLSLDAAAAGPVNYVYDELDRLVSVIDPSGDAANYTYDAVGNLLSIARAGTATVSISEVAPHSAPVGAWVTIYGTGFSATPASNTVTFNGTAATVTTASTTQLVTTVPTGATTGSLAVTTPNGSATSGTAFVVTAAGAGVPTITSLSSQVWDGSSALAITGTNFDSTPANDRVNLNVAFSTPTTAAATSLTVPVPGTATSGHVTVSTIGGTAVSAADFFIPPPGYLASNVQSTGRMTLGGNETVSMPTAGKFAMRLFDGTPGHRVSATFTNVTIGSGTAAIYDPYGVRRSIGLDTWNALFIDAIAMPTSATYTLVVAPSGGSTGNATVTLYDVVDVSGTIVAGGSSQTVTISTPGQNARLTFTETSGHRISLNMASTIGGLGTCTTVTITKPDGSPLVSTCVSNQGGFIDVQSLTTTGTYTVTIDPQGGTTGDMTLTLYDVPADVSGTIVAGGAPQTVALNTPGQNASVTFTGTNLERVSLNLTNVTIGGFGTCTTVTIKKPDGSPLASNGCVTTQGGFFDVQTLAASGTYTIAIDPPGGATGSMTLTLYDVVDVTGSTTVNGSALPVTISVPGQNANITVDGVNGQSIRIPVTMPGALTCATVTLLRQDNVTSVASVFSCGSVVTLPSTTLPATETYHVVLDPSGAVTGSYSVSVVSP